MKIANAVIFVLSIINLELFIMCFIQYKKDMKSTIMPLEYYKAGAMQNSGGSQKPKFVPKIIDLPKAVRADFSPFDDERAIAKAGRYEAHVNPYGAVSVVASNGKLLGVKLNEFEVVEWRQNRHTLSNLAENKTDRWA